MAFGGGPSVKDFFDLSKKFERITMPALEDLGREKLQPDANATVPKMSRYGSGVQYVKRYREEEEKALLQGTLDHRPAPPAVLSSLSNSQSSRLCELEELTSVGSVANLAELDNEELTQVYKNYDFSPARSRGLRIEKAKDKIVRMIQTNQVVIIQGATGCGKTTQVPQYILDQHVATSTHCNIIVTQPRRIAATSVARRVCEERGWELKTIVGYQIGLDNQTSSDTRLTFCTTGVLLQKLVTQRSMLAYTHVVLDEVHERDQEMDFLLLVVRKLLRTNSRSVKVILMSATIDSSRFAEYFASPVRNKLEPAPVLYLDKLDTQYSIVEHYLDQLSAIGPLPEISLEEPKISEHGYNVCMKLIKHFDKIDLLEYKAAYQTLPSDETHYKHTVLVFLPGIHEIEEMNNILEQESADSKYKWHIIPLHSSLPKEHQMRVFLSPKPGYRKIILSTNIAESSITVPDTKYVIDFCLTKNMVVDPKTNFSSLQLTWAARANCIQRAGRTGRVMNGRAYRLVPQSFYEDFLMEECEPEMLRCPLESTVLKAKLLRMGEPKAILALALDPPDLGNLERTILVLKEAGALLLTCDGKPSKFDGDITFLGRVMSRMPIDIHMTKLVVFGYLFSVLDDAVIIAACMSVQSMFSSPFNERLQSYTQKLTWSNGSCSDPITLMKIYKVYANNVRTNYFRGSKEGEKHWARRNYINLQSLREVRILVDELTKRLAGHGISEFKVNDMVRLNSHERTIILKLIIAGAFYPNYFVRGELYGQVDEREAVKTLSGKDPFRSVYLLGLPAHQPGELYAKIFKDYMRMCSAEMRISFDGSSKVFIEFGRGAYEPGNIPGKISMAVYRAVKLRKLRMEIRVPLLTAQEANKRMEKLGLTTDRFLYWGKSTSARSRLPGLDQQTMAISISYVVNPNHFWIHSGVQRELSWMAKTLNEPGNVKPVEGEIIVGNVYAAPYSEVKGGKPSYYRAQVACFTKDNKGIECVQVLFIDYGNSELVLVSDLRDLNTEVATADLLTEPPYAFECTLRGVKPPATLGEWSEEGILKFKSMISRNDLFGEIYSVVDAVISLDLYFEVSEVERVCINEELIKIGLADQSREGHLSEENHKKRAQAVLYSMDDRYSSQLSVLKQDDHQVSWKAGVPYIEPPSAKECTSSVVMRGPFSPLEMKVFGLAHIAEGKEAVIEQDSVNSVLLDAEPEDPHDRLVVAASVGQNMAGSRLLLRHTTVMPNLPGLPAILAMIFAPAIEMRATADEYTGMVCGLGYDPRTKESLFPEHDMEFTFDSQFSNEFLDLVNNIRHQMNVALASREGEDQPDATPAETLECQKKLQKLLDTVLKTSLPAKELSLGPRPYAWGMCDENRVLLPDIDDPRAIFRPHSGLDLGEILYPPEQL